MIDPMNRLLLFICFSSILKTGISQDNHEAEFQDQRTSSDGPFSAKLKMSPTFGIRMNRNSGMGSGSSFSMPRLMSGSSGSGMMSRQTDGGMKGALPTIGAILLVGKALGLKAGLLKSASKSASGLDPSGNNLPPIITTVRFVPGGGGGTIAFGADPSQYNPNTGRDFTQVPRYQSRMENLIPEASQSLQKLPGNETIESTTHDEVLRFNETTTVIPDSNCTTSRPDDAIERLGER